MRQGLKKIGFELFLVLVGHFLYTSYIKTSDYTIRSDGKGYYDYLPATFIYHDLNFGFRNTSFENTEQNLNHNITTNGKIINKYPVGLAIVWAPFFITTHEWLKNGSAIPHNGFSLPYHFSIYVAALFYLLIALVFLRKLLLYFTQSMINIRLTQFLILFATNLYIFSFYESAFSHVYSFCFITLFFYSFITYLKTHKNKYLYAVFVLLAIIVLIRPFNFLVVLFLPFLANGFKPLRKEIKSLFLFKKKHFVFSFLCFFVIISIQIFIWFKQSGTFLPWTYSDETFYFTNPTLVQTLFGFRKGLFVYTPLLLIALIGVVFLYKKNNISAKWLIIALVILHYFISSWQTWWYGCGFGLRPYIDFYSVFAILLVLLFSSIANRVVKVLVLLLSLFFVLLNIVQTFQYSHYIILLDEMNYEGYKKVFLKTDIQYSCFLDYQRLANEKKKLNKKSSLAMIAEPVIFDTGKWKIVPPAHISVVEGMEYNFVVEADLTAKANDRCVLFVSVTDTLNKIFHYEERPLVHFTEGRTGRQKIKYFFTFKSTENSARIVNFGFVQLQQKLFVSEVNFIELESN